MDAGHRPVVLIVGGGFAGLEAARNLAPAHARIILVDSSNHHTFQPLLYQVATAGLSPAEVASPIRSILRSQKNLEVFMGTVVAFDVERQRVRLEETELRYDFLIAAPGVTHSYFGRSEWEALAPGLKTIADATEIRRRILWAFERAELLGAEAVLEGLLTFVIVGGGPTGVEMAGAIAELTRFSLATDFRRISLRQARIVLLEAGPRLLPAYHPTLSGKARKALERLGVEVRLQCPLQELEPHHVVAGGEKLPARTVVWAAGVAAAPVLHTLKGAELDRQGRVRVAPDLRVPGLANVFVVGDAACVQQPQGEPVPGVAPAALQQGRKAAQNVMRLLGGEPTEAFSYVDKGSLATIGRAAAVAQFGKLRFTGFLAWLLWVFVHIFFLIGFRNKVMVLLDWIWAYLTFGRGARLIDVTPRSVTGYK